MSESPPPDHPSKDDPNRVDPGDLRKASRDSPEWWSAHWRRTAAVLAILVLLVGTHIPRLELGPPHDGPDKILHFFAFAVIAVLLRISDLGRTAMRTGLIAISLAVLDEITQELPGLNRSFDPMDLVADVAGTITALTWCAALAPTRRGSPGHRLRQIRRLAGLRLLLSSPMNWVHVATGGVLGAMLVGVFLGVAGRNPIIGPITMVVVGAITGFVAAAVLVVEAGCRHSIRRLDRERRCLSCLRSTPPGGECERCDGRYLPAPAGPGVTDRGMLLKTSISVFVLSLLIVVVYFGAMSGLAGAGSPGLQRMVTWYDGLSTSMSMALDATVLGISSALIVGSSRRRSAIAGEQEGILCLACGHDLQGTPHGADGGRCPECGTDFTMEPARTMAGTAAQGENAD